MFDPKLEIGQIITNKNLCEIFIVQIQVVCVGQ